MTFTNNTKGEYEILRLDQTDVRVETLSLVVKNLIDQNKQVYINASVNPNKGLYSSIWKNIFNELAEIDKVKITQSIGNQENTTCALSNFTSKSLAESIDKKIYAALNNKKNEIRIIVENKKEDEIITNYGAHGILLISLHNYFFGSRNVKIHKLVKKIIKPILSRHKLLMHEEEIVKIYASIIIKFSYSILLQSDNSKVTLVSSSSQFEEDDEYFLDSKVKLLKNKVRFPGLLYQNGEQIFGTSISAPLALSAYMNKSINN